MQCGVIDGRGERCGKGALDEAEAAALVRTLEMRLTASVARGLYVGKRAFGALDVTNF